MAAGMAALAVAAIISINIISISLNINVSSMSLVAPVGLHLLPHKCHQRAGGGADPPAAEAAAAGGGSSEQQQQGGADPPAAAQAVAARGESRGLLPPRAGGCSAGGRPGEAAIQFIPLRGRAQGGQHQQPPAALPSRCPPTLPATCPARWWQWRGRGRRGQRADPAPPPTAGCSAPGTCTVMARAQDWRAAKTRAQQAGGSAVCSARGPARGQRSWHRQGRSGSAEEQESTLAPAPNGHSPCPFYPLPIASPTTV